jgi:hypothetical protein
MTGSFSRSLVDGVGFSKTADFITFKYYYWIKTEVVNNYFQLDVDQNDS